VVKAEVGYATLVSVTVDLETGDVVSFGIRTTNDEDETLSQVIIGLETETDGPQLSRMRAGSLSAP
jgi:hypothetical protein